ncbi:DUF3306 domain-containing protein [Roseicyclus marinus]|uniref:DUF3306 domain-containing protein n=1 Tax=Roseicyclus marinus TaxID=2161673 RepID=A0AA48H157_9RHOB|nr:hypothetical protein MACH21_08410 [Roseicyclus marinus]
MSGDEPEGFLGRWSRIKRTAARSQQEPEPELEALPDAEPDDAESHPDPEPATEQAPPTLSEEELAALPRIEDLVPGSDIRPFLRPGVPRSLKNAALRRMWMLTPVIRDHQDPAVDYAWDWNTPGGVPGDGLAPSPERTAQMLKSLLSPQRDEPEPEAATQAVAEAEDAPETVDEKSPKAKMIAPTSGAPSSVGTSDEEGANAPDSVAEPDPPVRRRHGSALPG